MGMLLRRLHVHMYVHVSLSAKTLKFYTDYYMMREVYYMYTYTFSENKKTTSSP